MTRKQAIKKAIRSTKKAIQLIEESGWFYTGDVKDAKTVLRLLEQGKLEGAERKAGKLDTVVREEFDWIYDDKILDAVRGTTERA